MKRYRVTGTYSGTITSVVEAEDADDAQRAFCDQAWRQHGIALIDDVIDVRRIDPSRGQPHRGQQGEKE
jgi:hypothetical protein